MAGTLTISTLSDGTNSTSSTNCIQGSAKAWVRFTGNGSTSILASYNVSSVTYVGTGTYAVNMTNALTDANYSPVVSLCLVSTSRSAGSSIFQNGTTYTAPTTTQFYIQTAETSSTAAANAAQVAVSVFR